jgi:hypothetical protein
MAVLLPEAMGRDQPSSLGQVLEYFHTDTTWSFESLTKVARGWGGGCGGVGQGLIKLRWCAG